MKEEWRAIKGYENLYEVSNLGRVRSLERYVKSKTGTRIVKERILKPVNVGSGYLGVGLYKEGKVRIIYVHRLVAQAFIPNPNNLPEVNHKDENKTNNRVENLEWCTREYNMSHGTRSERAGKAHCKRIICLELQRVFNSIGAVAEYLDCTRSNVGNCIKNENKCMGYTLKFIEIEVL